jgi:hypothetical protein
MRQATPPHLSLHRPPTQVGAYTAAQAAIGLLLLPWVCPCPFLEAELAPRHGERAGHVTCLSLHRPLNPSATLLRPPLTPANAQEKRSSDNTYPRSEQYIEPIPAMPSTNIHPALKSEQVVYCSKKCYIDAQRRSPHNPPHLGVRGSAQQHSLDYAAKAVQSGGLV